MLDLLRAGDQVGDWQRDRERKRTRERERQREGGRAGRGRRASETEGTVTQPLVNRVRS